MMICALRVVCIACAGQQTVVALAPLRSGLQKTVPRLLDALRPGARTAAFNVSQALPIYRAAQSRDPPTDVSRIRRDRRQNQARAIADRRQNQRRAIADRRQNQRRAIADVFLYARATRAAAYVSNVPASAAGCVEDQRSDRENVQKSQTRTKPCMRFGSSRSRATKPSGSDGARMMRSSM